MAVGVMAGLAGKEKEGAAARVMVAAMAMAG